MLKKTWRPELVLLFSGVLLASWVLSQLGVGILHGMGVPGFRRLDDFGVIFLITMGFQGVTCLLIPFFVRQNGTTLRAAFGLDRVDVRLVGTVFLMVAIILPVTLVLEQVCQYFLVRIGWEGGEQAAVQLVEKASLWPTGIYLGLFTVLLAPVAEEFVFRGMLYPLVKQCGSPRSAFFGVSAVFAGIHFDAGSFVPLFVLALALTWLYERTDSLFASILAHSLFNLVNLVMIHFLPQIDGFLDKYKHG